MKNNSVFIFIINTLAIHTMHAHNIKTVWGNIKPTITCVKHNIDKKAVDIKKIAQRPYVALPCAFALGAGARHSFMGHRFINNIKGNWVKKGLKYSTYMATRTGEFLVTRRVLRNPNRSFLIASSLALAWYVTPSIPCNCNDKEN